LLNTSTTPLFVINKNNNKKKERELKTKIYKDTEGEEKY